MTATGDTGDTSDGYHTFNELYEHRSILMLAVMAGHPSMSWYSEYHDDGTMPFKDMFIVGMNLPTGQITYHLERSPWWGVVNKLSITKLDRAPQYDMHSSGDVVERLEQWIVAAKS